MNILTYIITVLCLINGGAHFYREGNYVLAILSLHLPMLLVIKKKWAYPALAVILALLSIVWISTGYNIYSVRIALGMPYLRMLIILLSVAAINIFGGWLLVRKK